MHGTYMHSSRFLTKKVFPVDNPSATPLAHGNFTHGLPVGPKFSKGAAPRRKALRAARARVDDRHGVENVGSNRTILAEVRAFFHI